MNYDELTDFHFFVYQPTYLHTAHKNHDVHIKNVVSYTLCSKFCCSSFPAPHLSLPRVIVCDGAVTTLFTSSIVCGAMPRHAMPFTAANEGQSHAFIVRDQRFCTDYVRLSALNRFKHDLEVITERELNGCVKWCRWCSDI